MELDKNAYYRSNKDSELYIITHIGKFDVDVTKVQTLSRDSNAIGLIIPIEKFKKEFIKVES